MLMYHADFLQKVALPTVTFHLLVSMRVISHLATLLQNKYIGGVLALICFSVVHLAFVMALEFSDYKMVTLQSSALPHSPESTFTEAVARDKLDF